ncbi:hypothetical protein Ndes2526B_g01859 [Nannochloris sp. 'desiccata']
MTDRYKQKETNFYCEYCNVWMANHATVKANHDSGAKHKANVAKKLSDMRQRSDREEKDRVSNERAMANIEAAAKRQYEADKAAETEHRQAQLLGKWELHSDSGYYYNAVHRWYYDRKTKMYYGGEPADWTNNPKIPQEAYYGASSTATKPKPPPPPPPPLLSSAGGAAARNAVTSNRIPHTVLPGMKIVHAHPQAGVGGYQMPEVGKIGGAKGIGSMLHPSGARGGTGGSSSGKGDVKRKRDGDVSKPAKPITKEEAEFLARREAARQRVQARSMQSFGLG